MTDALVEAARAEVAAQQVAELESPALFLLRLLEIAHGRKDDGRWRLSLPEMEERRNRRGRKAEEPERLEKRDHPSRERRAVARRRT